jgi:hypothetical protein
LEYYTCKRMVYLHQRLCQLSNKTKPLAMTCRRVPYNDSMD